MSSSLELQKRFFLSMPLFSYLKKIWHTQSKLLREKTWENMSVHVRRLMLPRCWWEMSLTTSSVIFLLGYGISEKPGEGTSLSRTPEKRGRWGMANGWRPADRSYSPSWASDLWWGKAGLMMATLHNVLSLVRCTLWTLLNSFIRWHCSTNVTKSIHNQLTQAG